MPFSKSQIDLGTGKVLRIEKLAAAARVPAGGFAFIEQLSWNDKQHEKVWLDWEQLQQGGLIRMQLSSNPTTPRWGSSPQSLPPDQTSEAIR